MYAEGKKLAPCKEIEHTSQILLNILTLDHVVWTSINISVSLNLLLTVSVKK